MLQSLRGGEVAGAMSGAPTVEEVGCMISFDLDVTINRPVETVFAFATDPVTFPEWQPAVVESRQTSPGPMGVGTTGMNARKVMGQRVESTFEVASYTQNQVLSVKSTSGPVAYEITSSFEPVDGARACAFTSTANPRDSSKRPRVYWPPPSRRISKRIISG
jgi:Polyketide cyclase / dehydrase and lipid transport